MNKEGTFSWKTLLILAGSYVSFGIGAGFATGSEVLQFWAPHGLPAILGLIISAALILICIAVVSNDCRKYGLTDMDMMYKHYCGKYLGTFIKWFNTLTFFLLVGSMIAGGASSLNSIFGIDTRIGTVIMLAAIMITALAGMKKLTDVLGGIAPIILLAVVVICVFSYIHGTDGITAGDQLIREKSGLTMSGNLIFSAILNFTYVVLNMSAYGAQVSTRADHRRELVWGNVFGQFATVLCQVMVFLAFVLNASQVGGTDIPLLILAKGLGSGFFVFYGIIVMLATYTTGTGMAWVAAANIQSEDSKWYKLVTAVVCIGAFIFSNFGTFGVLMNIVMKAVSYLGILFTVCMVVSKIYYAIKEKKKHNFKQRGEKSMLTRKENLLETIKGGHPDRFVNQYEYVHIMSDPIRQKTSFGCPRGSSQVNAWGVTIEWPDYVPGPFPNTSPDKVVIKDIENWKEYLHAPSVECSEDEWIPFVKEVEAIDRKEYFIAPMEAPGIFERMHYFMGMEECMIAFYENPDEMHEIIDYLTEWELKHAKEILRHYQPDALFHHDDWGSQKSSFLSPEMFQEFLLPAYQKIYGFWKKNGIQLIIHHSDSYGANLVPSMIEMGIDIWQGVMSTNDIPSLIQKYGGQIAFQGGIDNGLVDKPDWSPEESLRVTREICKICGTKYFIPSTTMGGPMSTYDGVYESVSESIDKMSKEIFA